MKKYFSISALALLSVLCLSATLSSCDKDNKDKDKGDTSAIVGTWESVEYPECRDIFTFSANGTGFYSEECEPGKDAFTWSIKGDVLTIVWDNDDDVYKYNFEIKNKKAFLYDDDGEVSVYNKVTPSEEKEENPNPSSLVGTWKTIGYEDCGEYFTFSANATGVYWEKCGIDDDSRDPFTWSVKDNILTLVWYKDGNYTDTFKFKVKNDRLDFFLDDDELFIFEKIR